MWIPKEDEQSCDIQCDRCTKQPGTVCLQLGNVVLAELCADCASLQRREVEKKLKTKPGPEVSRD